MLKNLNFSTDDYVLGGVAAFLVAILLFSTCGGGGAKTPETLGQKVFEAIKKDNMAAAQKYSVTEADLKFMVGKSDMKPEEREKAESEIKERGSKMKEDFADAWGITMNQLSTGNWDREKMEMGEVTVDLKTMDEIEVGTAIVNITEGDKQGRLMMRIFKHGGWKFVPPAMIF